MLQTLVGAVAPMLPVPEKKLGNSLQFDGFASDSKRMIEALRRDAQQPVQILLFSATFNDRVKKYALKVVEEDGHGEANQVRCCSWVCCSLARMRACV